MVATTLKNSDAPHALRRFSAMLLRQGTGFGQEILGEPPYPERGVVQVFQLY